MSGSLPHITFVVVVAVVTAIFFNKMGNNHGTTCPFPTLGFNFFEFNFLLPLLLFSELLGHSLVFLINVMEDMCSSVLHFKIFLSAQRK